MMWARTKRRRAMWEAINEAAGNGVGGWANRIHPVNGLRVIREFERINGVTFDPMDKEHRSKTYNRRALISIDRQLAYLKQWQRRAVCR